MSEDMQPKISRQEWESYNQGRMVRLNVNQKGAGRIEILNSFFVENQDVDGGEGIFGDVGADGLTPENAQNMYNKLVEIHQRNVNKPQNVNELKYGSHIYYTKEELTELAEAGGYRINAGEKAKETSQAGKPAQSTGAVKPDEQKEPAKLGFEDAPDNLSFDDFMKLNKEIQDSDLYKSLPYSAPERQAFYKWQSEQYERLRSEGISKTPKTLAEPKKTEVKQQNDDVQQESLKDAIAQSLEESPTPILDPVADKPQFFNEEFVPFVEADEAEAVTVEEPVADVNEDGPEAVTVEEPDEAAVVDESSTVTTDEPVVVVQNPEQEVSTAKTPTDKL